jgi:hypothetical protein
MSAAAQVISQLPTARIRIAWAVLVFIVSLTVYTLTLAPTVTLVDSGELIVAASSLGVAHPPGFPLYVVLAHLATLVPIGSVAVRVNFASAIFAALASAVVSLVVMEAMMTAQLPRLIDRARRKADRKAKKAGPPQPSVESTPRSTLMIVVSCVVSGLLLAFSRTLWAYATIAEVYTLTSLLLLTIFLLMFRWRLQFIAARRRQSVSARSDESKAALSPDAKPSSISQSSSSQPVAQSLPHGSLYAAAFLFGLALGVHHVSVGLMLPALAALVFATADIRFLPASA